MTLSVIIPVFNEVKTIKEIIHRVQTTGLVDEILVVDDGSTDGTRDVLADLENSDSVRVVLHDANHGKGKAVRTGIQNSSDLIESGC
jgi:glycosyltransferase involved in cell wall biosynthesis